MLDYSWQALVVRARLLKNLKERQRQHDNNHFPLAKHNT
jgi:hypothetical protein